MLYSLKDRKVNIDVDSWVAQNATVIGSVILERDSSVWFNAIIRGDNDIIHICEGSNIQDGCVLHTDSNLPLIVEQNVTVGHQVMLHGCHVEKESLIGMKAIILDRAHIGRNCLIGANTLITEGKRIPDGSVVMGAPGKVVRQITHDEITRIKKSANHYIKNSKKYIKYLVEQC